MPQRIQRKRTKGWQMPAGAVYVGRPSKWGNPYKVHMPRGGRYKRDGRIVERRRRELQILEFFAGYLRAGKVEPFATMKRDLEELRGKNLVCWCDLDQPCHADILLRFANQ